MVTTQNTIRNPGNRPEAGERMDNRQTWEKVCIKDGCESIIDCVNKTAPTVDYPTTFIMIRTNNIRDGRIDLSDIKYVTQEVFERWTRRILPEKGDIILTREAPLGEVGMIQTDDQIFLGQRLMQYRANPKYLDNRYLLYAFQDHVLQAQIKLLGSGATVEHMRVPDAEKLMLWLPPLLEQNAIATALSDVDALIASLDKLIAKKRDIKQATMQQLLTGKTRLPGFSGGWVVKKLGEIAEIVSGGTPSTRVAKFWHGNIKWCTPTDITRTSGKYLTNTEKYISELGLKYSSANLLPIGSLLLCSRATIGEVKIAATIVCTNQGFKSLICSKDVNNEFLYYVILTIKPKLVEKAIGSTFLEISKKDTALLEIALPPLTEQQAIATVLSDMDDEIFALEQKRDKVRALKQGMMQELLTGKTRLV